MTTQAAVSMQSAEAAQDAFYAALGSGDAYDIAITRIAYFVALANEGDWDGTENPNLSSISPLDMAVHNYVGDGERIESIAYMLGVPEAVAQIVVDGLCDVPVIHRTADDLYAFGAEDED